MIFGENCAPRANYYYNTLFPSRGQYKGNEHESMTRERETF